MSLIPLKLPPGIARNGTDFENSGRWRDANLVRWHNASLRPIGGWTQRITAGATITGVTRGMIAWVDNSDNSNLAVGTESNLYYISDSGTVYDITPSGFTSGNASATNNTAYGGGYYGGTLTSTDAESLYGTSQPSSGTFQEVTTWSLDNWGEYLLAMTPDDGTIYEWQLNTGTVAQALRKGHHRNR